MWGCGDDGVILIGHQVFWSVPWVIILDKDSMQMLNKYGDRGSPCLVLFVGLKNFVGLPLIRIDIEDEVIDSIIRLIISLGKLRLLREKWMEDHSIPSKTFVGLF